MKFNKRYIKILFLYLLSTFISNIILKKTSLSNLLLKGVIGYAIFALGLKYLTIQKQKIFKHSIVSF